MVPEHHFSQSPKPSRSNDKITFRGIVSLASVLNVISLHHPSRNHLRSITITIAQCQTTPPSNTISSHQTKAFPAIATPSTERLPSFNDPLLSLVSGVNQRQCLMQLHAPGQDTAQREEGMTVLIARYWLCESCRMGCELCTMSSIRRHRWCSGGDG